MASTRVLASRLASQMATKVARPAVRIQSRTIATGKRKYFSHPSLRDSLHDINGYRANRYRPRTDGTIVDTCMWETAS